MFFSKKGLVKVVKCNLPKVTITNTKKTVTPSSKVTTKSKKTVEPTVITEQEK